MSNADPRDDDLRKVYATFSVAHESQRNELMRVIAKEPKVVVSKSVANDRWYTLSHMVAALAAVLLLVIGSSVFINSNVGKAYGIETLTQRLLAVRSLHVQGFIVHKVVNSEGEEETKQFPVRWYFERPKRLWIQGFGFSDAGNAQATIVHQQNIGIDGDVQIFLDPNTAKRIVTPIDPRTSEFRVELTFQSLMFEKLIDGSPRQFQRVSSEQVSGVDCDVYELQLVKLQEGRGWLHRIWLNPRNGLPVRMDLYDLSNGSEPQLAMTLSDIRVNEDAPGDLFPLERSGDLPSPEPVGIRPEGGSASAGPIHVGAWYGLRLSPTKGLFCWTQHTVVNDEVRWFAHEPAFKSTYSESGETLQVETLREFASNGVRWRWSLVSLPSDEELELSTIYATIKYKGHSASFGSLLLQFPEDRLQEVFDVMQALTPGTTGDKVLTLESLSK